MMKKIIVALIAAIAVVTLSSYVINNHHSIKSNVGNDFIYYNSVTAWTAATDSHTEYIYYKEGNGVRKYYTGPENPRGMGEMYYPIEYNKRYKSNSCKDFRRNYRYMVGPSHYPSYFNCNLPYFETNQEL